MKAFYLLALLVFTIGAQAQTDIRQDVVNYLTDSLQGTELRDLTLSEKNTICMSFANDKDLNGSRKFLKALSYVSTKVFLEIEGRLTEAERIHLFWNLYYHRISCSGPPEGSPLAMMVAKGDIASVKEGGVGLKGGIEYFCETGLNPNLKDFKGLTIIEWTISKRDNGNVNLASVKIMNDIMEYFIEHCGCTPSE